jgi:hypothetical protein
MTVREESDRREEKLRSFKKSRNAAPWMLRFAAKRRRTRHPARGGGRYSAPCWEHRFPVSLSRLIGFVMWDAFEAIVDSLFVGPVWPASVLVLLVVGYLLLSLIGAVDFDGHDLSADVDGWQSIGATTLRWLHFGPIPIILWLGCFSIFYWLISYCLWTFYESDRYQPTLAESAFLAIRNAIIAALATKLVTGPLVPYLGEGVGYNEETMIGERCIISSIEATPAFGQAKFATGGAPLLLNIRTDGSTLVKGEAAIIIAYDTERRLYTVTSESNPSESPFPVETSHE